MKFPSIFLLFLSSLLFFNACKSTEPLKKSENNRSKVEYIPEISDQDRKDAIENCTALLRQAIYHGAKRDKLSKDFVQALVNNNDLWVGKCRICDNVRSGLKNYAKEAKGEGLPAPYDGASLVDQKKFLKQMVDNYVGWYVGLLKMNSEESSASSSCLEAARKAGMNGVSAYDFCPSCDGACHKP